LNENFSADLDSEFFIAIMILIENQIRTNRTPIEKF